jgi:hypothetical protein
MAASPSIVTSATNESLVRKAELFEMYRSELEALGINVEVTRGGIALSASSAGVFHEIFIHTHNQSSGFGAVQIESLKSKIGLSDEEILAL